MAFRYTASVLFTPLEPVCFRWYGLYTWLTTGPFSQAVSEPLPLPSTLVGALIYGLAVAKNRLRSIVRSSAKNSEDLLKDIIELLKLNDCNCSEVALRGPYIISQKGIALHLMSGHLVVVNDGKLSVVNPMRVVSKGVALRRDAKSTIRHMLYSVEYVDLIQVLGEYKIVVDILCNESCELMLEPVIVRLGSDGRAAKMSVSIMENSLSRIISEISSSLFYVASPILLSPSHLKTLMNEGSIEIDGFTISALSKNELEHLLNEKRDRLVKYFRMKIQMLATGYDMLRNSLREMYPAILPGSVIHMKGGGKESLLRGLGKYSYAAWGTAVPLKVPETKLASR